MCVCAPPPPCLTYTLNTTCFSIKAFQLTIRPLILVPNARKTLIRHSDFLVFLPDAPEEDPQFREGPPDAPGFRPSVFAWGLCPPFLNSWIRPWLGSSALAIYLQDSLFLFVPTSPQKLQDRICLTMAGSCLVYFQYLLLFL